MENLRVFRRVGFFRSCDARWQMLDQFVTTNRRWISFPFRPGDAVRVTRGALAGTTGILVRTAVQRCTITIDGLGGGVMVILPAASLQLADTLSDEIPAPSVPIRPPTHFP